MFQKFIKIISKFTNLHQFVVDLNKVLVQTLTNVIGKTTNIQIRKEENSMTTLGLQWLQHKENVRHNTATETEDRRSNLAREANTRYQVDIGASTANKDRASREKIASLDRTSREEISAADRSSRENIASADRSSKEYLAYMDRELTRVLKEIDVASRENMANLDREAHVTIENEKRRLEQYKADLVAAGKGVATMEGLQNLGYGDDIGAVTMASIEASLGILGQILGGRFSLN